MAKPLFWLGDSRKALQKFPADARRIAGYQLRRVQEGFDPSDWKPMPSIGAGVREIRVHADGEWRVIYLANRPEGVYVVHAFGKKTGRTPKTEIDLARNRLARLAE